MGKRPNRPHGVSQKFLSRPWKGGKEGETIKSHFTALMKAPHKKHISDHGKKNHVVFDYFVDKKARQKYGPQKTKPLIAQGPTKHGSVSLKKIMETFNQKTKYVPAKTIEPVKIKQSRRDFEREKEKQIALQKSQQEHCGLMHLPKHGVYWKNNPNLSDKQKARIEKAIQRVQQRKKQKLPK